MNRALKNALLSLIFNSAFAVYYFVFGILMHSLWFLTVGVYYVILSFVRFAVLVIKKDAFAIRLTGSVLMLLSLPLAGATVLAVIHERGIVVHEILMISIALYAFSKITLAAIQLIKARRGASAQLVALLNISFADAFVSIFSLQRSMLVSFEGMTATEIGIMNAMTGSVVCITAFLLGLNLIRNKKILFHI